MKRVRLVSIAAAGVVTAVQWAAFFNPALYAHSMRSVAGPVAADMSERELPVIGVTTNRESFFKY
jgi:hypothetical protein